MPVELISDYLAGSAPRMDHIPASDVMIAEANHRIANNLALIAGMVHLRANEIAKEGQSFSAHDVRLLLEEVSSRIQTVGRLHRLLAHSGQTSALNLHDYLHEIAEAAISSMAAAGEMTLAPPAPGDCEIPARHALPIGVIVGELVTNAVKYAHPARVRGRLEVSCETRPGGATLIRVSDDGVGLGEGFDPMKSGGLGMRMIRSLAQQVGGRLSFESSETGLTVRLLLPPPASDEA